MKPDEGEFLTICRETNYHKFKDIDIGFKEKNWKIKVTSNVVWYEELSRKDFEVDTTPPSKIPRHK